ncbi:MAG: S-layer homology domain-containing protein, partial [Oscillospiraceae bacterium]
VALNGGTAPVLGANATPTYTDIKGTWAEAYIEYCSKLGIVAGMGDGTFAPDATVTGSQAAKMILVALGYDSKTEGFTGSNWEIAVGVRASQKGLYSGLSLNPSAGLTRDNAAGVIYNGINAVMVTYDYKLVTGANGQLSTTAVVKDDGTKTVASEKFGLTSKYATLTNAAYNSTTKTYTYTVTNPNATYNTATASFVGATPASTATFTSASDFSALFGENVKILYTTSGGKTTVYGVYAVDSVVVSTGVFGSLATDYVAAAAATTFTSSTVTYKFDAAVNATPIYAFNVYTDVKAGVAGYAPYTYKFIDKDGNGKIDFVVVYPYSVEKVTYVGATTATFSATGSETLSNVVTYTGMAKDDFVKKTLAANTVSGANTYEKITTIDGAVSATNGTKVMIGTNWMVDMTGLPMTLGTTYTKMAQVNGFIYAATATSSVTSAAQYAVVLGAVAAAGINGNQAKMLFSDGTIKTVDTDISYAGSTGLYTFTVSSSTGKYTLDNSAAKLLGNYDAAVVDGADVDGIITYAYSATAGMGTIEGNAIDDAATIFVNVAGGTAYKVMTGAQFKLLGAATITYANVVTNTTTGFKTVKLAYASINSTALGSSNYGYVTANVTVLGGTDGTTQVSQISFWNGTETKTLKTSALAPEIVKGMIISYTMNADGTFIPVAAAGLVKSAVTAYDGTNILFNDGVTTSSSVSSTKTTVMYIDSANYAGVAGGAIGLANKNGAAYIDNAYYVDGTTSGFALIVMDTKNAMANVSSVTVAATAADTAAELAVLFDTYNTVTVSDAGTLADVTVPTGKTLNVSAATTITALTSNVGTLNVNGATTITTLTANTGVINVNAATTVTTLTANAGTINVNAATTIATLTGNAGTINVAAAKTLTVTNCVGAAVEKVVGAAATSTLVLTNASSNTAVTSAVGANLKFWATAGATGATNGTTDVAAGVVAAKTYTWKTVYYQTTAVGDTSKTAWCE